RVPSRRPSDPGRTVYEDRSSPVLQLCLDHGWSGPLRDSHGHQLSTASAEATAPEIADGSVFVDDVNDAYDRAVAAGVEIIYPLTAENWGVTRFFYRDRSGNVINVGTHSN